MVISIIKDKTVVRPSYLLNGNPQDVIFNLKHLCIMVGSIQVPLSYIPELELAHHLMTVVRQQTLCTPNVGHINLTKTLNKKVSSPVKNLTLLVLL